LEASRVWSSSKKRITQGPFSFGCCAAAAGRKKKKKKERLTGRLLSIGRSRGTVCVFFFFLNGWQRWKFGIDTFAGWEKKKKS
jgi:hypothetical protein